LKFITAYKPDGSSRFVTSHSLIAKKYINGGQFFYDLLPWFPITFMNDNGSDKFWRLFYLVKLTRFVSAMRFMDIPLIMRMLKKYSVNKMAKAI